MAKMSNSPKAWILRAGVALVCTTLTQGLAQAQTGQDKGWDLLDQMRREEKVADQKVALELRSALAEADKLALANPDKALERLQETIKVLEQDTTSAADSRQAALRKLNDRVRKVRADMARANDRANEKDKKEQANADRKIDQERFSQDVAEIRARLAVIRNMQDEGKDAAAARDAGAFAKQEPRNIPAQASEQAAVNADNSAASKRVEREKAQGFLDGSLDVSRSSIVPKNDMEFPKDWAEKTKRRSQATQLTSKERVLLKALGSSVSVDFKNTKLQSALDYLQTLTGQTIVLDHEGMKEVDATYDSPVNMVARGVSLRTVLRKILAECQLTYIIRDEAIQVTSIQRAKDTLITRQYYIGDILAGMSTPNNATTYPLGLPTAPPVRGFVGPYGQPGLIIGGPVQPNPTAGLADAGWLQNQAQTQANAKNIIDIVKGSVDTNSWDNNGGLGSIVYHAQSMSLIIKQTAEMHALIGSGFAK
jgi:hypothetical protein